MPIEGWITAKEAAELTGYDPSYIRLLARRGLIPGTKVGQAWLVERRAVLEWRARMDTLGTQKHNAWRERWEEE